MKDFHANVTRNHGYKTIWGLMVRVEQRLEERNEKLEGRRRRKAA